jgi:Flp pilus assembly protein TadG
MAATADLACGFHSPRAGRRAAAAVELALILPLLVFIVLLCVDFGRFAYTYIAVHNAVRAGGAYAIMNPVDTNNNDEKTAWDNAVQTAARDEMTNQTGYNANNLTVTTTITDDETTGFRNIRIEASYSSFTTVVPWPGIPSSLTLTKAVEMRAIR